MNVSLETIAKLSAALGCDPADLLSAPRIEPELTLEQQAEYARAAGLPVPGDM